MCLFDLFIRQMDQFVNAALGTVTRCGIGVYNIENGSAPAIASICPLNYRKNVAQISLANPEDLCSGGRTGILCGHCSDGYSVVFGSSVCRVCSNMWLVTILMYAILWALLVAGLYALNLTVAQGTLYRLIFVDTSFTSMQLYFSTSQNWQVMISLLDLSTAFL